MSAAKTIPITTAPIAIVRGLNAAICAASKPSFEATTSASTNSANEAGKN